MLNGEPLQLKYWAGAIVPTCPFIAETRTKTMLMFWAWQYKHLYFTHCMFRGSSCAHSHRSLSCNVLHFALYCTANILQFNAYQGNDSAAVDSLCKLSCEDSTTWNTFGIYLLLHQKTLASVPKKYWLLYQTAPILYASVDSSEDCCGESDHLILAPFWYKSQCLLEQK